RAAHSIKRRQGTPRGPFSEIEGPKFRLAWNQVKAKIGLEEDAAVVPTVLRHTCAARMLLRGVDIHTVQGWLGNRDYKSMIKYRHLAQSDKYDLCVTALESW